MNSYPLRGIGDAVKAGVARNKVVCGERQLKQLFSVEVVVEMFSTFKSKASVLKRAEH